jgi:hypothetical protein
MFTVMLQHNILGGARDSAWDAAAVSRRAHLAHAAMISLHVLCCGLPLLALTAAAGVSSGLLAFSSQAEAVHVVLHTHEVALVAASALLVLIGAGLEWAARARQAVHGFPWMMALSAGCFVFNLILVGAHRFG